MIRTTCFLVLLTAMLIGNSIQAQDQNSTRKIRVKPTDFSSKCGSAVEWRASVDRALDEAATSGKPVFWYVPTIGGSFMDRKPVIDQYMMAGPFSWPAITDLINEHFIPVRAVANRDLQSRFETLVPYKFVEPGFVIIRPDGNIERTVDQITTLDPKWLLSLLAKLAGVDCPSIWQEDLVQRAFLQASNTGEISDELKSFSEGNAEASMLHAMLVFKSGDHQLARQHWQSMQSRFPDHPLAWKAAAEAENWGPFVRGFERLMVLPDEAYLAGLNSRGSMSPSGIYSETELWERSSEFLLEMQNQNGGWYDSDYDFGGTDSLPNVYVAVSALCGSALIEMRQRFKNDSERLAKLDSAIDRAINFCSDTNNLNTNDRDEILWANAFRVRLLAQYSGLNEELRGETLTKLNAAVDDLESIQTPRGTWYHEYANSFVTATALTALKRAADAGADVNMDKIELGVASLANDRFDNGAYPYYGQKSPRNRGTTKSSGRGQIPASAGRMPICELGLWQWDFSDDEKLQAALTAAFEHHQKLAVSYKYDNHTDTLGYGGFFFWYDMRSRAEALTFLSNKKLQQEFANSHRELVLSLPELDGCFVDSHELGRCYGTAMALLTLAYLDEIESK